MRELTLPHIPKFMKLLRDYVQPFDLGMDWDPYFKTPILLKKNIQTGEFIIDRRNEKYWKIDEQY